MCFIVRLIARPFMSWSDTTPAPKLAGTHSHLAAVRRTELIIVSTFPNPPPLPSSPPGNAKNWRAVERDGLEKAFPQYAAQVSLYQAYLLRQQDELCRS